MRGQASGPFVTIASLERRLMRMIALLQERYGAEFIAHDDVLRAYDDAMLGSAQHGMAERDAKLFQTVVVAPGGPRPSHTAYHVAELRDVVAELLDTLRIETRPLSRFARLHRGRVRDSLSVLLPLIAEYDSTTIGAMMRYHEN